MHLLDANVFIDAKRRYYAFGVCPGFWDWLDIAHEDGRVASVESVRKELIDFGDDLSDWVDDRAGFFHDPDDAVTASLAVIAGWVATQDYTAAAQVEFLGSADYYLIAQAHAHEHTVVTHERPEPNRKNKVKIPDVCDAFAVEWRSPFELLAAEGAEFILAD